MANIRPDLIASRYANLPAGPTLFYSFETQTGIPVDGGKQILRDLSPFTLKLLPPDLLATESGTNTNLISRANSDIATRNQSNDEIRNLYGAQTILGTDNSVVLSTLQRIVSAGQVVSGSSLTERAVFTDALTAADVRYQVELLLQVPPLTLLVNPKEMSITYSPVQQYQNRAREGFIFERWGENQPTISFSGTTGGFIAGANPTQTSRDVNESPSGLQWASRRDSAAFQNFVSLYQFYRNNGYIHDLIRQTRASPMVGCVSITYDQWVYEGHITNFAYSYQEEMLHRLEWSLEFTVDRMYDLAESPGAVLPMKSLNLPPRTETGTAALPGSLFGGTVSISGFENYAESPLDILIPTRI